MANGMPELHGLMPPLGVLQDKGYKVAIITDGRMSGASGKVPSAIHMSPEAMRGGLLSKIQDGDKIRFDVISGTVELLEDIHLVKQREFSHPDLSSNRHGFGRELFSTVRGAVSSAEEGGSIFPLSGEEQA
jgi:phosphogluconate dehydratase